VTSPKSSRDTTIVIYSFSAGNSFTEDSSFGYKCKVHSVLQIPYPCVIVICIALNYWGNHKRKM